MEHGLLTVEKNALKLQFVTQHALIQVIKTITEALLSFQKHKKVPFIIFLSQNVIYILIQFSGFCMSSIFNLRNV